MWEAAPLEYLFAALAGCIGTVSRIVAMQKRIPLKGMDMKVESRCPVSDNLINATPVVIEVA